MHTATTTRTYITRLCLVGALYAATLWLSLTFLIPPGGSGASLVWPPSAVALAALFFFGFEIWPALLLPFFLILVGRDIAAPLAFGVALGNTLEAAAGAYFLFLIGFRPLLSRVRDVLSLVLVAFVASLVSAAAIHTSTYFFGSNPGSLNVALFLGVWVGHAVSILSFTPFLFYWYNRRYFIKTSREIVEGVAIFGSIFTLTILTFWTPFANIGSFSLIYILLIPFIWAALRSGPRGISLALLATALIATTGLLHGYGPATLSPNVAQALFGIQIFIGALSLIFLPFTSMTEERKDTANALHGHVSKLEEALKKISSEDQAKTDFIAILAHELRNPLSPIVSSLEIMKQNGILAVNKAHFDVIDAHVHTIARLLDDLLDISRITRKRFKLQKESVELASVLRHSFESARPFLESRKHTLVLAPMPDGLWLDADPVRLGQIFVNLLLNAGKYTPPGGTVEVRVAREGTEALVYVRDSGIGIEKEMLQKIFEPFVQGTGGASVGSGLGVGLSLTKRLAELHGGTVSAHSEGPGRGSEFLVRLPLSQSQPLPLSSPAAWRPKRSVIKRLWGRKNGGPPRDTPLTILVVDDNEAAAQGLGTLLERTGHAVHVAYSGMTALARAAEVVPHVVLLDIGLPDKDGYEVARALRAAHGNPLVLVALTGYGQEEDKQKAKDASFDYHLTKPVGIADVEEVLAQLRKRH